MGSLKSTHADERPSLRAGPRFVLPQSLREWLPEDHLVHFVRATMDALDLSAFYKPSEGGSARKQPFQPVMIVKVLVCACAMGEFSSRQIARKLHEVVALRVLAAANFPKHRTICDFQAPCSSDCCVRA